MPSRSALVLLAAIGAAVAIEARTPQQAAAPAQPPAPAAAAQEQAPVFRTGVEVLPVDVTVVDRDGRQVTDLTAADFQVEVDGRPRKVLTAEYIKLYDPLIAGQRRPTFDNRVAPAAPETAISSNNGSDEPPGRAVLLLVDQGNIRFGSARPVMQNALKFVDRLQSNDRIALVAVPAPGELVDFTLDHAKVREAMLRVTGRFTPTRRRFNISMTEAFAIYRQSDALLIAQVILRECAGVFGATDLERCERDVEQEASEIVGDQRQQTDRSLAAIQAVLSSLGALDGPKSVILISEGLVLEGLGSELDAIGRIAADVRASLDVLLLDVPLFDAAQSERPTTATSDRRLQEEGLEILAGMARGTLHRVVTTGETAFRRIEMALAGYYLLGVEPTPGDRDGRRHRIEVKTPRRGVTLQARRNFLAPEGPPAATPTEALNRTLKSPAPATGVPLRMSTWTYKEPGSSKVRVLVAAEAERGATESLAYAAGLVVATREGKVIAASAGPHDLPTLQGDDSRVVYAGSITVDPGEYRLRVGIANADKRVGSVERSVTAWQMNGDTLALGDLLLAAEPEGKEQSLAPSVEPRVDNGTLVALAEAYAPAGGAAPVAARIEVLKDESGPSLVSAALQVGVGASPEVRLAQGRVPIGAIPPGSYLARVSFTEGGTARGALTRPFRVVAPRAEAAAAMTLRPGAGAPPELLAAVLGSLPAVSKDDLLDATTTSALWAAAEQGRRPEVLAAIKTARGGQMLDGALAALSAGDQSAAAFVRGMDFLGKAQLTQAATQFETAMRIQGGFAAARAMLGACLLLVNREKEAAGLLMSLPPAEVPALGRLAGEAWLRAGQPAAAIAPLEQSAQTRADARSTRALALAYALTGNADKGLPALAAYLKGAGAKDGPALAAAVYATYRRHLSATDAATIAADRTQARTWARAYAVTRGPLVPLVQAWAAFLEGAQ
ncbi:MAG: VWA domain-containing protein [Vicinamibacterales bacterium]